MGLLNRDALLQTLKGYAIANDFIAAERKARLKVITVKESLEVFASLYEMWKRTGKLAGGNMDVIERRRLDNHIELRRAFEKLAKQKRLI